MARKTALEQIEEVAKVSEEKANIVSVKYISTSDLFDYPNNREDLGFTEDIKQGIETGEWIEPLLVTSSDVTKELGLDLKNGQYMIVRGHRRRRAYEEKGVEKVPCIVRTFASTVDIEGSALSGNHYRNTDQDPLLLCTRYKREEAYVKATGEKKVAEIVANRMGLSRQQADRYKQFNKIIKEVWVLVRAGKGGLSNFLMMASHTGEEQKEIYNIIMQADEEKQELTRSLVEKIVKGYREGKKSFSEIIRVENIKNQSSITNDDTQEIQNNRNNEIEYDTSHREGLEEELGLGSEPTYEGEEPDYEMIEAIENSEKKEKEKSKPKEKTEEDKIQDVEKSLAKLEGVLQEVYSIREDEKAYVLMQTMGSMIEILANEITRIADKMDDVTKGSERAKSIIKNNKESLEELFKI